MRITLKSSGLEVIGYLKGESSLLIFDRYTDLKYKYGSRHFWCCRYYVNKVGKNARNMVI